MSAATHAQILEILGEVDDLLVRRLMATGASRDEIAEALEGVEDERQFGEERHVPSSPRVLEARAILEELVDDTDDEAEGPLPTQTA